MPPGTLLQGPASVSRASTRWRRQPLAALPHHLPYQSPARYLRRAHRVSPLQRLAGSGRTTCLFRRWFPSCLEMSPAMAQPTEVPSREPVFHVLRAATRPRLKLLAGMLPLSADFPHEAVDDSLDPFRQAAKPRRGGVPTPRRREGDDYQRDPRQRQPVTERFRTRFARTHAKLCGSVRIPVSTASARTRQRPQKSIPAAASPWLIPSPFPTRLAHTRVGACGGVRIHERRAPSTVVPPAPTRSIRPSRNPLPATPSHRLMPDRFRIRPSRTRDAVCGFVRIQDGPHPSRKDARA